MLWDVWDFSDDEPKGYEVRVGRIEADTHEQAAEIAIEQYGQTAEVEPAR